MIKTSIKAIPLVTRDSSTLNGTLQPINPEGLPEACFMIRVINGGTTSIEISYDGTNVNDVVFLASVAQLKGPVPALNAPGGLWPKGTIIYATGTAGVGTIGVAGYYQPVS